jgi:CubicO group peptidase (beta-lactamase class C family)
VFSGVILVARGDSILFEKAYGLADVELDVPVTTGSAFRIASISKSFTRALTGRLADRGVLALDDPVARWMPDFPEAERITIRLLLDHRAGVPNRNSLLYDEEALAPNSLEALVDSLRHLPLDFEPGTETRYSNGGYAVLARVLEMATSRDYESLLEEEIVRPVGLRQTGHEADGELVPGLARGYAPSPAEPRRMVRAPFQEMATKTGGGSLVSTAHDLLRWARAIGHHDVLEKTTWGELFPEGDSFSLQGRSPGYNAVMQKDSDLVAVVLANNYAAGMVADVAGALLGFAAGRAPTPLPVTAPVAIDQAELPALAGSYRIPDGILPLPPGTAVEIRQVDGDLIAHIMGSPVDVLVPQGGRTFLLRALWSAVTFDAPEGARSPGLEVRALYRDSSFRATRVDEASRGPAESP